MIKFLC